MPRYPMVDTRGFVVGSIIVNDDVIPSAMMSGMNFLVGGQWAGDQFISFIIVPEEDYMEASEPSRERSLKRGY